MSHSRADVCVIGGGPAGLIAAIELARLGFRVEVIDDSPRRSRWAETVPSQLCLLLAQLGLQNALAAATIGPITERAHSLSPHGPAGLPVESFLIDRATFDTALREAAAAAGVKMTGAMARGPLAVADGSWRVPFEGATCGEVEAHYLVLAGGRRALLQDSVQTGPFPIVAYYGIAPEHRYRSGAMAAMRTAEGWCWGCATPDGQLHVVALSPAEGKRPRRPAYGTLIEAAIALGAEEQAGRVAFVAARDATTRTAVAAAGVNWIRVGDALLTVDPLTSSGLYLATLTAVQAARVINTVLRHPHDAEAAWTFYTTEHTMLRAHYGAIARSFYEEEMTDERLEDDDFNANDFVLQSGVARELVPVLCGNFIQQVPGITISGGRPIAFIGGTPVGEFIAPMLEGSTLLETSRRWPEMPEMARLEIMRLLVREKIVARRQEHGTL